MYLLKQVQAALHAALVPTLREHGATIAQYAVLTVLDEQPGLSNADLARWAFLTPQSMNQTLLGLERKGWVTRSPRPGHGRVRQAVLTSGGHAVLQACDEAARALEEQMLSGLGPQDRQRLEAALRACIVALASRDTWIGTTARPDLP